MGNRQGLRPELIPDPGGDALSQEEFFQLVNTEALPDTAIRVRTSRGGVRTIEPETLRAFGDVGNFTPAGDPQPGDPTPQEIRLTEASMLTNSPEAEQAARQEAGLSPGGVPRELVPLISPARGEKEFQPRDFMSFTDRLANAGVRFQEGVRQGLTLGVARADPALNISQGRGLAGTDMGDIAQIAGDFVGSIPLALVSGGLGGAAMRFAGGRIAGGVGRALTAMGSQMTNPQLFKTLNWMQKGGSNVIDGFVFSGIRLGAEELAHDDVTPIRVVGETGTGAALDFLIGAAFGRFGASARGATRQIGGPPGAGADPVERFAVELASTGNSSDRQMADAMLRRWQDNPEPPTRRAGVLVAEEEIRPERGPDFEVIREGVPEAAPGPEAIAVAPERGLPPAGRAVRRPVPGEQRFDVEPPPPAIVRERGLPALPERTGARIVEGEVLDPRTGDVLAPGPEAITAVRREPGVPEADVAGIQGRIDAATSRADLERARNQIEQLPPDVPVGGLRGALDAKAQELGVDVTPTARELPAAEVEPPRAREEVPAEEIISPRAEVAEPTPAAVERPRPVAETEIAAAADRPALQELNQTLKRRASKDLARRIDEQDDAGQLFTTLVGLRTGTAETKGLPQADIDALTAFAAEKLNRLQGRPPGPPEAPVGRAPARGAEPTRPVGPVAAATEPPDELARLRAQNRALKKEARRDPLNPQVLNKAGDRRVTQKAIDLERRTAERRGAGNARDVARIGGDLENFKAINDELGQDVGDQVLAAVGEATRRALRNTGAVAVARKGGDEFGITLRIPQGTDAAPIRDAVERAANEAIQEIIPGGVITTKAGREVPVGAAFGDVVLARPGESAESLIARGDAAVSGRKAERGVSAGLEGRIARGEEAAPAASLQQARELAPEQMRELETHVQALGRTQEALRVADVPRQQLALAQTAENKAVAIGTSLRTLEAQHGRAVREGVEEALGLKGVGVMEGAMVRVAKSNLNRAEIEEALIARTEGAKTIEDVKGFEAVHGQKVIVFAQSTKQPGKIQASYFDAEGPSGDSTYPTMKAAISSELDHTSQLSDGGAASRLARGDGFAVNKKQLAEEEVFQELMEQDAELAASLIEDVRKGSPLPRLTAVRELGIQNIPRFSDALHDMEFTFRGGQESMEALARGTWPPQPGDPPGKVPRPYTPKQLDGIRDNIRFAFTTLEAKIEEVERVWGAVVANSVRRDFGMDPVRQDYVANKFGLNAPAPGTLAAARAVTTEARAARDVLVPGDQVPRGPMRVGNEAVVIRPDGSELQVRYALVEINRLIPSHDPTRGFDPHPDYWPEGVVQQRDYKGVRANQERVVEAAGKVDPKLLITDVSRVQEGPPLITSDGRVLNGNERTMLLQLAQKQNPEGFRAYQDMLRERAGGFVDRGVKGLNNPVLVRVLNDPGVDVTNGAQLRRLNVEFDQATAKAKTAVELAGSRSAQLLDSDRALAMLSEMDPEETVRTFLDGGRGKEFVEALAQDGVITREELGGLVRETGDLTQPAKDQIHKMLLGAAVDGDMKVIEAAPISMVNRLDHALPTILMTRGQPGDVGPIVKEALQVLAASPDRLGGVVGFRQQKGLGLGETSPGDFSPLALDMAETIQETGKRELTELFRAYSRRTGIDLDKSQVGLGLDDLTEAPESVMDELFGAVRRIRENPSKVCE
jgi:diguanylate cyclase (GGDEF)-like protein